MCKNIKFAKATRYKLLKSTNIARQDPYYSSHSQISVSYASTTKRDDDMN